MTASNTITDLMPRIVAPHDRRGDSGDRTTNEYFSRLFFFRPSFRIRASFLPSGENWGQFVHDAQFRLQLAHGVLSSRLTPFYRVPGRLRWRRLSPHRDGRRTGVTLGLNVIDYDYAHSYRANPRDAAAARGMTGRFDVDITFRPRINRSAALTGQPLWIRVWIEPRTSGITADRAFAEMARSLTLEGGTLV